VVNPGAAPGQEASDGSVGGPGREQLDLGVAEREADDGGAVSGLRRVRLDAQYLTVESDGGVEVFDGDADMGNAGAIGHDLSCTGFEWLDTSPTATENNAMSATSAVHVSDATFAGEIEQVSGLVLVDFWATWCGPCQVVAPVLEQLAGEYAGRAKIAKLDVDSNQRTAMRFNVRSIPSILFFKDGRHVDTVVGAVPKTTLDAKIKQHL
jgi:thioredoxin 1